MKNNFLIKAAFVLLTTSAAVQAQEVKFHRGSWADAITIATTDKKLIMVDAYTDWCGWCKVMDKKTFTDANVIEVLNKNFISVKKEMEKETDGQKLAMKYHVNSFPTFLFFTQEGKLLYVSHGYEAPDDFIKTLEKVLDLSGQPPGEEARTKEVYNLSGLNPGFPDFYKTDFQVKRPKVEEKTVSLFLDEQTDKASEVCWGVLWRFNYLDVCAEVVLKQYTELKGRYGRVAVEEVTQNIIYRKANVAIKEKNKENYQVALGLIDKYMSDDTEKSEFRDQLNMSYYKSQKDWAAYAGVMQPKFDKVGAAISGTLNEAAWTLYEECDNQVVLKQAAGWMKTVTDAHPEYMYLDTYAALLYKTKDYKEALRFAEMAINDGEKNGEDVSATKSLLEQIKVKIK